MERAPRVGRDLDPLHGRHGLGPGLGKSGRSRGELGNQRRDERPPDAVTGLPQVVGAAAGAGATATPQGAFPTGMRPMTLSVPVSTTEMSFDGPLAV